MARPLQNLTCPFCHAQRTSRATKNGNATKLERYYQCNNCEKEFTTVERISRAPLDGVYVLRPRSAEDQRPPSPRKFDPDQTSEHLRVLLRKLLTEQQREDLLNRVMLELPRRLDKMERVREDDPEAAPWRRKLSGATVVPARAIRRVIEECMAREAEKSHPFVRRRYEAAHALYLMSAVNRSLNDAMALLAEAYPTKISDATLPAPRLYTAERWHYPLHYAAPHPRTVVKNFWRPIEVREPEDHRASGSLEDLPATREPRNRVNFSMAALDASILRALGDSPSSVLGTQTLTRHEVTTNVREWVLWKLDGQPVVRSSQLSAEIAAVLRRCAPQPYLRWVTIGKELRVEEVFEEAKRLLEYPPIPLEFDVVAAPRMHGDVSPADFPGPRLGAAVTLASSPSASTAVQD